MVSSSKKSSLALGPDPDVAIEVWQTTNTTRTTDTSVSLIWDILKSVKYGNKSENDGHNWWRVRQPNEFSHQVGGVLYSSWVSTSNLRILEKRNTKNPRKGEDTRIVD